MAPMMAPMLALPLAVLHLAIVGAPPAVTSRTTLFEAGFANYSQYRIPALLVIPATPPTPAQQPSAAGDIVLAFAEARGPNHQQACDTCNTRIAMRRSTNGGSTFGSLMEITHAHPTTPNTDWTGNAVPLYDAGDVKAGRKPSVTLVYSHNNNYVLYVRSTDLGQT